MLAPRCRFVILQGALRARLRVTGSDRFRRMIDQRRFKIGAGLGYDLLAEFGAQRLRLDLLNVALIEIAQLERPERHADEPVHLEVERLQDLAHLAVLAFADADGEPDIGALFAVERRLDRPVMHARDGDAGAQPVKRRLHDAAERAHAAAPWAARRRWSAAPPGRNSWSPGRAACDSGTAACARGRAAAARPPRCGRTASR